MTSDTLNLTTRVIRSRLPRWALANATEFNAASPVALKKGQPGTPEFRTALRDAIEGFKEFVGSQGVFNLGEKDHNGVDARSQVMVRIEGGQWKLVR